MRMFKKIFIVISLALLSFGSKAQTYEQLEKEYNQLLNNKQNELALTKAKELYYWVKTNEADTSLHLPISLKLIGNSFQSFSKDSSIKYYDIALSVLEKQNRLNHIQTARIHNNKSNIYFEKKANDLSLIESLKAVEIYGILNFSDYPICTWPLNRVANLYSELNEIKKAEYCFKKIDELAIINKDKEGLINSKGSIAYFYLKSNSLDLDSANAYCINGLSLAYEYYNKDTSKYYQYFDLKGRIFWIDGNISEAATYIEVYQNYSEQNYPQGFERNSFSLIQLYLVDLRNINRAQYHINKLKDHLIRNYGVNSEQYLRYLSSLAGIYWSSDHYEDAIEYGKKVLMLSEKNNAPPLKILEIKGNINLCLLNLNKFDEAKTGFCILKKEYEKSNLTDSIGYKRINSNLALCYRNQGNIDSAIIVLEKFLKVKKTLEKNDPNSYYEFMNLLGEYYLIKGEKAISISSYSKTKEYYEAKSETNNENFKDALEGLSTLYLNNNDYLTAINTQKILLNLDKEERGEYNHEQQIKKLIHIAEIYRDISQLDSAKKYNEFALKITNKYYPEKHILFAYCYYSLGYYYLAKTSWFDAREFFIKSATLFQINGDTLNDTYIKCLGKIADHELLFGNKIKGLEISKLRLEISRLVYPNREAPYFRANVDYLYALKSFISKDSLNKLYIQTLTEVKLKYGEKTSIYVRVLREYISEMGEYLTKEEELSYLKKIVVLGEECKIEAGQLLYNYELLVNFYFKINKTDSALFLWQNIFAKIKQIGNRQLYEDYRSRYAADLITECGRYQEGLDILVNEFNSIQNKKHFHSISEAYIATQQYDKALSVINDGLNYVKVTYGINSNEYLFDLDLLVKYYNALDDYGNIVKIAESRYLLSKKLNPLDLDKQSSYLRMLLNSYAQIGDFDYPVKLIDNLFKEFKIDPFKISQNDPKYDPVNELMFFKIFICSASKLYGKPILSDNELIELANKFKFSLNSDSKELTDQSFVYFTDQLISILKTNELAASDSTVFDLIKITEEKGQDATLYYRYAAEYYLRLNNYTKAMNYATKSNSLAEVYRVLWNQGESSAADSVYLLSSKQKIKKFSNNFLFLNEAQQLQAKDVINTDLTEYLNHIFFNSDPSFTSKNEIYNLILNSYGIVSKGKNLLMAEATKSNDSIFLLNYSKWIAMSKKYSSDAGFTSLSQSKFIKDSLERLEQLLYQSSSFRKNSINWIDCIDIKRNLKSNEAIVQVYCFPLWGYDEGKYSDTLVYLYFISKPELSEPKIILKSVSIEKDQEDCMEYSSYSYGKNSLSIDTKSYENYFGLLEKELSNVTNLYFISDGVYNKINLSNLYITKEEKYLADKIKINYLISSKSLLNEPVVQKNISKSAILIGNPTFEISNYVDTTNNLFASRSIDNNADSISRGVSISPLPGTQKEISKIHDILTANKWTTKTYSDLNATEFNVKNVSSPNILHIATHGYFLEDVKTKPNFINDQVPSVFASMQPKPVNSLLKSGLLFTGVKNYLNENKFVQGEDGILTASEATFLDLKNTELVVLSACETGRGKVLNGEGVFGLRKSFFDAGAKNMIISLWKVDDNVTQEFMELFYKKYLANVSLSTSFYETQMAIKLKYPQPYYWAAFVLVK